MTTKTWTDHHSLAVTTLRNGSKVANITEEGGRYRVSMHLDYGDDGTVFCYATTYKSKRGAMRRAQEFVE